DWLAMALICIILPAVLSWAIGIACRKLGWIREGDLKLD
ncbi:MAG: PTS sugar transporter subunit IIC, partial [Clostridia bacterium]|nr:PTS sugar transporter subunit IIC [Clostridia bacterium]